MPASLHQNEVQAILARAQKLRRLICEKVMKLHKVFINDRQKVGCERWGSEISPMQGLNRVKLFPLQSKTFFANSVGRFEV